MFVLGEKISRGFALIALTAGISPTFALQIWMRSPEKCHSNVAYPETDKMERGKPHKRETQIMVGALF
ncbi:hypothetical protein SLU01_19630 [Sporosarcina luteola]|uniref:Uncharacterized protein n=1 Tax=Sporosarcina luteola TaxID=582850 RepID=A0A511Z874_9BACL|nr:hypothetical protein SLU01_19630 [Sporosarcina luteola]